MQDMPYNDLHKALLNQKQVVYGGTSAGVVAAKRTGASVILLCPEKQIGGVTTGGLSWTDIGDELQDRIIGGHTLNFVHRVYRVLPPCEYMETAGIIRLSERNCKYRSQNLRSR